MSDETDTMMYQCASCRHHMQMDPDSEDTCMSCFNQDNWEPSRDEIRTIAADNEALAIENDRLEDDIEELLCELSGAEGEVRDLRETVIILQDELFGLRDENKRLRIAYGGAKS